MLEMTPTEIVNRFGERMRHRLKDAERKGKIGWETMTGPELGNAIGRNLVAVVERAAEGNMEGVLDAYADVGAFCAFGYLNTLEGRASLESIVGLDEHASDVAINYTENLLADAKQAIAEKKSAQKVVDAVKAAKDEPPTSEGSK